jgi:hypothetical protein
MPTKPLEMVVNEAEVPDETVIWRYMPFNRFVEILEEHKIWFSRPFNFDDRWEGLFPPSYVRSTRQYANEHGIPFKEFDQDFRKRMLGHRYAHFVNCWHLGEHESDGMWRLYAKEQNAVAIRSTVGNARECFRPHGSGQVIYYDPSHDILSRSIFGAHDILFKREAFRWEGEYRFWFCDDELLGRIENGDSIDETALTRGKLVMLGDTTELIQRVVVAPGSTDEFIEEVRDACAKTRRNWMSDRIERSYSDMMWDDFTRL